MRLSIFLLIAVFSLQLTRAAEIKIPVEGMESALNDALADAQGVTTITLPAGEFYLSNEVIIDKPGITLRGQGAGKTILSFKNQKAGPQGIIATKDQVTFEDFAVLDSFGNGIKVIGANHVTIRRMRVDWTRGQSVENGAYGVYPVLCENVLIEDSEVSSASDAGVYVGQSRNIIVRRNKVYGNVAGIEIENSSDADVMENTVTNNTAGVLVFNLPDLVMKDGVGTRIYNNLIQNNNIKNFSMKGTIINLVPKGLGVFLIAAHGVEVFDNDIEGHSLSGVAIANYAISERTVRDPEYNPMPRSIEIRNNRFSAAKFTLPDGSKINFIIKILTGMAPKDVVYDGIDDGTYNGQRPSADQKICLFGNVTTRKKFNYANLHLDNKRPHFPFPGGPATREPKAHECELPRRAKIVLEEAPVLDFPTPDATEAQMLRVCKKQVEGVNWEAFDYDCPELSDYNLFEDAKEPRKNPRNGIHYSLKNQLFTDYALKERFIFMPPGKSMAYREQYSLEFPHHTFVTKTFSLNARLVETRVLVKRKSGWVALNYVWDKTGKARLSKSGFVMEAEVETPTGNKLKIDYHVPNLRQCSSCHFINEKIVPIGLQAKHLNRPSLENSSENQLAVWAAKKTLTELPELQKVPQLAAWDDSARTIDDRAKAYLEINCAHCHTPKGNARNTGLYLQAHRDSYSVEMGHCKTPVAAGIGTGGNSFDVKPGQADQSILYYRISHNHLGVKMPQLGRSTNHVEGNELIKKWINEMAPSNCK